MTIFTIGADPEIFLRKKGLAASAHGVIPGTKKEPYAVKDGAYQVDGMAVEFNIDPTTLVGDGKDHFKEFNGKITSVMKTMQKAVKEYDDSLSFNISSVQDFSEDVMKEQPPEATELGCDPDFCAYTGEANPRPEGDAVLFRTGSGHLHFGWDEGIPVDHPDHLEICCNFIKYLDATVGLFMTILDDDPRRRELYGKAGAFRPKSYGCEYRTPSNVWLTNVDRRRMIHLLSQHAVSAATAQYTISGIVGVSEERVQEIINTGDFKAAYDGLCHFGRIFYLGKVFDIVETEYKDRCKKEGAEGIDRKALFDAKVKARYKDHMEYAYKLAMTTKAGTLRG